jgi:Tfp pilus assembly protein PilZ
MSHTDSSSSSPSPSTSTTSRSLEVDVAPDSESHFFVDLSGDVANAGIFVATWRGIPVGATVEIVSELPDGPIAVSGRVRWVREASGEIGPGIGVALESVPEGDLARIASYCAEWPPYFYEVDAA